MEGVIIIRYFWGTKTIKLHYKLKDNFLGTFYFANLWYWKEDSKFSVTWLVQNLCNSTNKMSEWFLCTYGEAKSGGQWGEV